MLLQVLEADPNVIVVVLSEAIFIRAVKLYTK